MITKRIYLVVGADKSVRAAVRPRIAADEIAIPIRLEFPGEWGKVLTDRVIDVQVPDFTPEVIYEQDTDG